MAVAVSLWRHTPGSTRNFAGLGMSVAKMHLHHIWSRFTLTWRHHETSYRNHQQPTFFRISRDIESIAVRPSRRSDCPEASAARKLGSEASCQLAIRDCMRLRNVSIHVPSCANVLRCSACLRLPKGHNMTQQTEEIRMKTMNRSASQPLTAATGLRRRTLLHLSAAACPAVEQSLHL